jgi:uncharacterized protein (TIGR03083 family)
VPRRLPVTADDVDRVVDFVLQCLRPSTSLDWTVPAGTLDWTCRQTVDHMQGVLVYAGQLAIRKQEPRYVRLFPRLTTDAMPASDLLEGFEAAGRLLAMVVRGSPPEVRAWSPRGYADPEGYAGAGCVEALIHGWDVATGLRLTFDPPRDVCERVLARMFPDVRPTTNEPWTSILWATGRVALPGQATRPDWRWDATPQPLD